MNVVLCSVLYAHALVAPRISLGWLRPLAPVLGDPRLGLTEIFLQLSRVVPDPVETAPHGSASCALWTPGGVTGPLLVLQALWIPAQRHYAEPLTLDEQRDGQRAEYGTRVARIGLQQERV
jgi:hypothetical protein